MDTLNAPTTTEPAPPAEDTTPPDTGRERPWGDRERAILDFEAEGHRYAGLKETRIREEFGVGVVHYYMELRALLVDPRALEYSPVVVNRLRRAIVDRHRERADRDYPRGRP